MPIDFPTGLDALTNPGSTDTLDQEGVEHDVQHSNLNDIVEALEAKVGITNSGVVTSIDSRLRQLGKAAGNANAWDDEFDDVSLDGKWGWANQGAASIALANGCAALAMGSQSDGFHSVVQSITGTTWRVEAKFWIQVTTLTDYPYYGIVARESGTDKLTDVVVAFRNNITRWGIMNHSLTNSTSPSFADIGAFVDYLAPTGMIWLGPFYAAIERNGNEMYYDLSNTPGCWRRIGTLASITSFYTSAPDQVGMIVGGSATNASRAIYEYIRKVA